MGKLFGTDGVRGLVFTELTPHIALKVASATCTRFGEDARFLVGRDIRLGGVMLEMAVASGLLYSGCTPVLAGLVPTPALQYVVGRKNDVDGGIMITASHNPREYNGIKVIDGDGIEIPRWKEDEIEEIIFEDKVRARKWGDPLDAVEKHETVREEYLKGVINSVDIEPIKRRRLRVIVDSANSVGSLTVPRVVRKLGGEPVSLNSHLDPFFPSREPEPTPSSLEATSRMVASSSADLGVGLDGDADRSIFIDEKGRVHWGDRIAIPLAVYLKEKHPELPKRVYTGISSSFFVETMLSQEGIEVVWMKVGSVDISRRLASEGGLLGFEENGGIMYPVHHPVRDATMATALVMEMLSKWRKPLSEIIDEYYPQTYTIKTKIPMDRQKALDAVKRVKEHFQRYRMIEIDGVKILLKDAWLLVRPSGTEPVLRIMIEAPDETSATRLLEEVKKLLKLT